MQAVTRPEGTPLDAHVDTVYAQHAKGRPAATIMPFQKERMKDMRKQADELTETINIMQHMYGLIQQLTDTTHHMVGETHEMQAITDELRDHIADFEDFLQTDPQLLLLGKALLRYSHLLVAEIHIRFTRRC